MSAAITIDSAPDIAAMRAWCEDVWSDYDPEASDAYVVRVVEHHYDGGVAQFLRDGAE
jgi:hypothetical protein